MSDLKIKMCELPFEIDTELYFPGCTATAKCPECGQVVTMDLAEYGLSYPWANGLSSMYFDHEIPQTDDSAPSMHEWTEPIVLRVSLELAK